MIGLGSDKKYSFQYPIFDRAQWTSDRSGNGIYWRKNISVIFSVFLIISITDPRLISRPNSYARRSYKITYLFQICTFVENQNLSHICAPKLRQTWIDTDFTQLIWVKMMWGLQFHAYTSRLCCWWQTNTKAMLLMLEQSKTILLMWWQTKDLLLDPNPFIALPG